VRHRRSVIQSIGIAGIVIVFGAVVCAATPPPDIPPDKVSWDLDNLSWAAPVTNKPTTGLRMGRFKIVFEKTRLSDVMAVAGGEMAEHGDAAEHNLWLCFTVNDSKPVMFRILWPPHSGWYSSSSVILILRKGRRANSDSSPDAIVLALPDAFV